MSSVKKRTTGFRVTGVDYSSYLMMRASAGNSGYRMTYDDGVLWIMSPEFRHELGANLLDKIVWAFAEETGLDCLPAGATTFRKGGPGRTRGKAKEGDETYYLGALASRVHRDEALDLAVDPPPSLWIEVDNYGDTRVKLPLYAALGVPEVWQYRVRRKTLKFWCLGGGAYTELSQSLALPGLTPGMVLELLDKSATQPIPVWIKWMRTVWFPQNRALFPDFTNQQP